jgi:hypothetical protein
LQHLGAKPKQACETMGCCCIPTTEKHLGGSTGITAEFVLRCFSPGTRTFNGKA